MEPRFFWVTHFLLFLFVVTDNSGLIWRSDCYSMTRKLPEEVVIHDIAALVCHQSRQKLFELNPTKILCYGSFSTGQVQWVSDLFVEHSESKLLEDASELGLFDESQLGVVYSVEGVREVVESRGHHLP